LIPGAMFVFGFFCLWVEIFTLVEGIVWKITRPCMWFGAHFSCRSWVPVITYVVRGHEGQCMRLVALDRQHIANFVFLQGTSIWLFSFTIIFKTLPPVIPTFGMDVV
jgi:hypothetical protein